MIDNMLLCWQIGGACVKNSLLRIQPDNEGGANAEETGNCI